MLDECHEPNLRYLFVLYICHTKIFRKGEFYQIFDWDVYFIPSPPPHPNEADVCSVDSISSTNVCPPLFSKII